MTPHTQVSIVIPTWNSQRWLSGCLQGLKTQSYRDFELVVVDNGSSDSTPATIRQIYPEARIIELAENLGFAAAVNLGVKAARGELIVLLNIDTIPAPEWLVELVQAAQNSPPRVGSWASKMLSLADPTRIDDAGDTLSVYGSARKRGFGLPAHDYTEPTSVFSACAGAGMYRREFFDSVGLLDERFTSYLEDVDLGFRGQLLGWECRYVPTAQVLHKGQGSGTERGFYVYLMTRNRLLLISKNMPSSLLLKHAGRLLYGQLYFFLVYKHPLQSLRGIASFFGLASYAWQARQRIQHSRVISDTALEQALSHTLGEPSLWQIVMKKIDSRI